MSKLKIGLLLCDDVDEEDRATYGSYAEMFRGSLTGATGIDGESVTPINCYLGDVPAAADADDFDAFLISGSRCAAYDSNDWILQLQEFVRECYARRKKTVGICFGHQLIAQALGGETRKADAGWGIGIHRTRIVAPQPWMDFADDAAVTVHSDTDANTVTTFNLVVIHQDQVIKPPPDFRVIAASDFCPVSMMVGDATLGIQGHPEFDRAFCESRIHARREILGEALVAQSLASLDQMELDSKRVLRWVMRFIADE